MPNNWKKYKLSDTGIDIIDGDRGKYYPSQNEFYKKEYCLFLSTRNVTLNGFLFEDCQFITKEKDLQLRKGKLQRKDIVITTRGTIGNIGFYNENVPFENIRINSGMVILRFLEKQYLPEFYHHFFKSKIFTDQVSNFISGSAQPQLPIKDLKCIEVPLLPLPEQQAIAEILSSLDDKIELNLQTNKTLEEMANALYKYWFVDFGPFKNGKFIESELGMIPENFKVLSIGEVSANNAKTFNFNGKEKVIFINTGDVLQGEFLHTNYSNVADLPGQAKKAIELNDILFTEIRPGNKRYALINFDSSEFVVSTKFMVIKSNEKILPRILYRILRNEKVIGEFQKIAESRSGTFPQITFDAIKHLNFVIGDLTIQNTFMEKVLPMELLIDSNNEEIKKIKQTRDYLLPKLITGQIRVKDAEKMAKEVLCRS